MSVRGGEGRPGLRRLSAGVRGAMHASALACAALAPLVVQWWAGRTLVWFDTLRLYAPERWMIDDALRSLRLPLWNPFVAGGMPLLADAIHGVLHPVSVLAALLGTSRSADVLIGGYVVCAALGAAWLARELGASRGAAAAAAFTFGMSGFVLSMAGNLVFLAGAASLPWCVAGLRRFAADPGPWSLAIGGAGAALLALAGDVQALVLGGVLGVVLGWQVARGRGAARAAVAGASGLLLGGAQLVPSTVHFFRSARAADAARAGAEVWALEPWRLPELALPGLLWAPDPLMDPVYGAIAGPGHWMPGGLPNPFAASVFVGVVPIALAIVGVRASRSGAVLGGAAAALAWIALGPVLGASRVLGAVPVWSAFRYPEKLVGPLTLLIAVLAALGLDAVAEGRARPWRVCALGAALALGAWAACALVTGRLPADLAAEGAARVARGAWHVVAAAAALGAGALVQRRLGPAPARALLAAAVWATLAAAAPAALRPGDLAARLGAAGPALAGPTPGPRIVTPYEYEPLSKAAGDDWIDVAASSYAARGYAALNARSRLDSIDAYAAMIPSRLTRVRAAFGARWPAAAGRYGVTHVVTDAPRSDRHRVLHDLATRGASRVDAGGDPEVWAIPHRPWASFPAEVRAVTDEGAALAETVRAFAERSDRAVVEAYGEVVAGPGHVVEIRRGLESLRVDAEAPRGATLVVADAWWPGWEAAIDGVPVPVFRADALVRAVRWPPGRHVLEMRYRPPEVGTGLLASAAGVVVLGAGAALLRRRGGRPGPAAVAEAT